MEKDGLNWKWEKESQGSKEKKSWRGAAENIIKDRELIHRDRW